MNGIKMRLKTKIILIWMLASLCVISVEFKYKYKDNSEISGVLNIFTKPPECLNELNVSVIVNRSQSPSDNKYILLWSPSNFAPFNFIKEGNKAFIENRCPKTNCYVTTDRKYFGRDLTKFDAIAFNGRDLRSKKIAYLHNVRSSRQKYIYFNKESPENHPCCNHIFDGFFNWTATFKLNSDIVFPYLVIKNRIGEVAGPKVNMIWNVSKSNKIVQLNTKKAAVAWVASNCETRSKRERYVKILKKALKVHKLKLDIYGACGSRVCPRNASCDGILSKYFFYLSFENSIAEDYVTEKLYTALKNGVVPIVFGGADYSRFLPPASYLDAMKHSPHKLALKINRIINDPRAYSNFFNWRSSYSFSYPEAEEVCSVCAALNNQTLLETKTVYKDFRSWWNPDYVRRCKAMMRFEPEP